jgi:hypothetical protein
LGQKGQKEEKNINLVAAYTEKDSKQSEYDKFIQPTIFNKNINNNFKLIPIERIGSDEGDTQYFPAHSKEWTNSVYHYNQNITKNLPVYDLNIYKIIKSYFNLYFTHKFIKKEYISRRIKRQSLNKIYLSKPEIKHTNSQAIITLYSFNRERFSLVRKIKIWLKFIKKIVKVFNKSLPLMENLFFKINIIVALCDQKINSNNQLQRFETFYSILRASKVKSKIQANQRIRRIFKKELLLTRKYKLRLNLNKYKFEDSFLSRLSSLISRYYNKEVIFNIINLKSIIFNSDLFTEITTLKVKKSKAKIHRVINIILNKAFLPKVNRIQETARIIKSVDPNKLKIFNLDFFLNRDLESNNFLDKLLNNTHTSVKDEYSSKPKSKLNEIILNGIKYKNIGGIRLEIKGRLTKRYRADRAVFKLRWKGGLKNIDSSYKGLSVVKKRGYINPNVEYSICSSKRRIGAFAVKGWMSGKL